MMSTMVLGTDWVQTNYLVRQPIAQCTVPEPGSEHSDVNFIAIYTMLYSSFF